MALRPPAPGSPAAGAASRWTKTAAAAAARAAAVSVGGVAGAAGGLGRGSRTRRTGAGTAGAGSGVGGPGPPEKTGSGQHRCRLATAEARGARRARGPRRGSGGPEAGAGGVVAEPGRGSGTRPGLPAGRALPEARFGVWGSLSPGGGPWGRPSPPLVAKGVHALRSPTTGDDLPRVFSQVVGSGESTGNREGKVLNWGSSGSKKGGWGERVERRDSFLGFRSEVVSGIVK